MCKQQALDADQKATQYIHFTIKLDKGGQTGMYFIIEEPKESVLYFIQGTVRVL